MRKDVKEYVTTCEVCQRTKVKRHLPYSELSSFSFPSRLKGRQSLLSAKTSVVSLQLSVEGQEKSKAYWYFLQKKKYSLYSLPSSVEEMTLSVLFTKAAEGNVCIHSLNRVYTALLGLIRTEVSYWLHIPAHRRRFILFYKHNRVLAGTLMLL